MMRRVGAGLQACGYPSQRGEKVSHLPALEGRRQNAVSRLAMCASKLRVAIAHQELGPHLAGSGRSYTDSSLDGLIREAVQSAARAAVLLAEGAAGEPSAPRWTLKRLAGWVKEQCARVCGRETIRRARKRLGLWSCDGRGNGAAESRH